MTQAPITTIRELNVRAQAFWAKRGTLMMARLENPVVREAAFAALKADWERGVPSYFQKTLEHQLQLAAEAYESFEEQVRKTSAATNALAKLGAKFREAQRVRAQRPRRKVTEGGRTLSQIIKDFVLRREHHEQSTKELWPPFFAELDRLDLSPEEIEQATSLTEQTYIFTDCKGNERKITYSRFANIVSSVRQKRESRQPG